MSALFTLFLAGTAYQIAMLIKNGTGTAAFSTDNHFLGQSTSSSIEGSNIPVFPVLGILFTVPALLSAIHEWRYARWVRRKRAIQQAQSDTPER